ncbi:hypothetical protein CYY_000237 [Polysphondylium violaceum]|uniref:Uncharacterized protein n=1 Tax=Polysphondylium violaceum TaxID=133409 RepID=A0A8J4Q474_9MYCE|nr:hypothetical protein CYY_000237 [Polysphondylium violaceum]
MNTFYLIWRNQYIRKLIRNLVCRDQVICVNDGYLNDNHQYLSVFTDKDKIDYNISIRFIDNSEFYFKNQHRSIINDLDFYLYSPDRVNCNHVDFNQFTGFELHRLSLQINCNTVGSGPLPESLTELFLDTSDYSESAPIVLHILSHLPCNLKTLKIPIEIIISEPVVVPDSLTSLEYYGKYESLQWVVVPPNKVFSGCQLQIDSVGALEWLKENKWVDTIYFYNYIQLDSNTMIPDHVRSIQDRGNVNLEQHRLPSMLQELICRETIPSQLSHLKILTLTHPIAKLEKNQLPASLEHLDIHYSQPLDAGVLPPNLTKLYLYTFDQILGVGVLPPNIKYLNMPVFNQPLMSSVLPTNLLELSIYSFDQPLLPHVLPSNLQILRMLIFDQPTLPAHSLPNSIVELYLNSFKGSILCKPLDHLKRLQLHSLHQSVSTLLQNVKRLSLKLQKTNDVLGTCLANTRIEKLCLDCHSESCLYPNSLPPTLKSLTLSNIDIQAKGTIPNSCVDLTSLDRELNPAFIPTSVKYSLIK